MKLTESQYQVLKGIQDNISHGDIETISGNTKKSRVHVSRVLNPEVDVFNEAIVDEAVKIIAVRKKKLEGHIKTLTT